MRNLASSPMSRRDFLRLLMLAGGGVLASCSRPPVAITEVIQPTSSQFTPSPIQVTQTSTVVASTIIPNKIDTVIILLQENHSFDSLFAGYPGANGKSAPNICPDAIHHAITEGGTSVHYYCSYAESQVPNYWKLAHNFTLCDNYFSEVRGPSFPNYLMLTSAYTPTLSNPNRPYECPNYCVDITSLASRLDAKGLTWHDYGGLFANIKSLQGRPEISYKKMDGFFQNATAGNLSNVTWIGAFLVGGTKVSGHPPANICDAENFATEIVNAAMNSPQWPTTLLILIWDEWGGSYEHTVAPVVEKLANGKPFRYGLRVPCLVISPYAKAGVVAHTEYSHVSTLRTIEAIYDLQPLNERDANANSLLDCLDFSQAPIAPLHLSTRTCTS